MTTVFVDTSAVYALLVSSDDRHEAAKSAFQRLSSRLAPLVTTSYVLVETAALLGRRVGLDAVRRFHEDLVPLLEVVWVDAALHHSGVARLLEGSRQGISLVDAVSFAAMRERGIEAAYAFDRDFEEEGFTGVE